MGREICLVDIGILFFVLASDEKADLKVEVLVRVLSIEDELSTYEVKPWLPCCV